MTDQKGTTHFSYSIQTTHSQFTDHKPYLASVIRTLLRYVAFVPLGDLLLSWYGKAIMVEPGIWRTVVVDT